ncbi:transmembrane protein, putative (macronuclear) [Tetrahymena thermophila SB210]|uniref:Transmembrane protein, putative n=1 Tax=Tetrahymena thermophila (strain SB210) TaxID=312017 RepID=W7XF20_TETTS|nr:transmembrane protein, putative [Tetrahymena thermophila SB210]EWS76397.1 transmembrane protein, putative [Tetrahymena thermophila SB210]|eukprot:XP_012651181.1 transmembrane protein, putative [Tetrahymena thermophila SB210]
MDLTFQLISFNEFLLSIYLLNHIFKCFSFLFYLHYQLLIFFQINILLLFYFFNQCINVIIFNLQNLQNSMNKIIKQTIIKQNIDQQTNIHHLIYFSMTNQFLILKYKIFWLILLLMILFLKQTYPKFVKMIIHLSHKQLIIYQRLIYQTRVQKIKQIILLKLIEDQFSVRSFKYLFISYFFLYILQQLI